MKYSRSLGWRGAYRSMNSLHSQEKNKGFCRVSFHGAVCLYPLSHLPRPPAVHLQASYLTTLCHAVYFCIMLAAGLKGSSEEVIVICYCWPPYLNPKDSPEFQNHMGPIGKQSWWCDSFRPVSQVPLLFQLKADAPPCGTRRMGSELRFEGHKELSSRIAGDKGAQIPR